MGFFSKFENRMEDTFEGAAGKMSKAPISPVQIAKKAEKQMRRETMVGAGKEYAPTLYTVLVNPDDDQRLFGYYPTLAGETETYLSAKAAQEGLVMDGQPLVRFVVDESLKHGKFDVIAEAVAAPIIEQLRAEEMARYGIAQHVPQGVPPYAVQPQQYAAQPQQYAAQPQQYAPYQGAPQQPYAGYADGGNGYNGYPPSGQGGYPPAGQDGYAAPVGQGGYANDAWEGSYGYADYIDPEPEPEPQPVPQQKPPLPYVPEEEIDRSIDYGEYTFNSEDFENYREKADSAGIPENKDDFIQPQQTPNTVTFTAGAGVQSAMPNSRTVRACLIDTTYHRSYDLAGSSITLGRDTGNNIVVQDINASRKHAELKLNQQGIWVITDLNSMNGTLVNGISVAAHPLYPGDIVTIGKTDFRFDLVR